MTVGIAQRLDEIRVAKGLSYPDVAERAELPYMTIYKIFKYRRDLAARIHLDRLCEALETDRSAFDDLLKNPPKKKCVHAVPDVRIHTDGRRYDLIMQAIKDGQCDEQIMDEWPNLDAETLAVYHKIIDGTTCCLSPIGGQCHNLRSLRELYEAALTGGHITAGGTCRYHGKER